MLYALSHARWFHHPHYGWYRNGEWLTWWIEPTEWPCHTWRKDTASAYLPKRWP